MMKQEMVDAINEQINKELYSAYLYLAMSAQFESDNLPGFANWMRVQAQEEVFHAMKFNGYVNERGGRVLLKAIDEPRSEWASPLEAFEHAYEHEQFVTSLINGLVKLSIELEDYATQQFLHWYVEEQVEEEATASGIAENIRMVKDAPGSMYMLDKELGQRVYTPPPAEGGE